jgi:hypothetical protein
MKQLTIVNVRTVRRKAWLVVFAFLLQAAMYAAAPGNDHLIGAKAGGSATRTATDKPSQSMNVRHEIRSG